mmetsp:Transcript_40026/g.82352  ORF Transcript_40026/g.82352 Transcript_40026/m.82352 type:complete len:238 (-) Transcript_40026:641-1354(-)
MNTLVDATVWEGNTTYLHRSVREVDTLLVLSTPESKVTHDSAKTSKTNVLATSNRLRNSPPKYGFFSEWLAPKERQERTNILRFVLQGRAGKTKTMRGLKLEASLRGLGLTVSDGMSLIEDDAMKIDVKYRHRRIYTRTFALFAGGVAIFAKVFAIVGGKSLIGDKQDIDGTGPNKRQQLLPVGTLIHLNSKDARFNVLINLFDPITHHRDRADYQRGSANTGIAHRTSRSGGGRAR